MEKKCLQPENWVIEYGDYLLSIAIYKVTDRDMAKDLVQETFLAALKSQHLFRGDSNEKTWLSSILNNKIIDQYRKKKQPESLCEYLESTSDSFNSHFFKHAEDESWHLKKDTVACDWGVHADAALVKREFYAVMEYCLSKLPQKMKPVFFARYFDEKKADEICNDFNISSSNYWVIIHRSKILIRSCIEKNWFLSDKANEQTENYN